MEIIKDPPINGQMQALVREIGTSLIVNSSLFLKNDDTLENLDKIISIMEIELLRLRKAEKTIFPKCFADKNLE